MNGPEIQYEIRSTLHADPMLYKVIKREMDSQTGIISQVIIASKASGLGRQGENTSPNSMQQYAVNVGLKVRQHSTPCRSCCFFPIMFERKLFSDTLNSHTPCCVWVGASTTYILCWSPFAS